MRIAFHLARASRWLLIASLLALAVGLSLARYWLLPKVEGQRLALQEEVSQRLGRPLLISGLSAHMRGFNPSLVLKDVAIMQPDGQEQAVWLGQIHLSIDVLHWLSSGEWRTAGIALQGADLSLRRHADGDVSLDGVPSQTGLPPWLFGYGRFELRNCRLTWHDEPRGESLRLASVDFSVDNRDSHHRLTGTLALAGHEAQRLAIQATVQGDATSPASLKGRIYMEGHQLRAQDWPTLAVAGYTLRGGTADFRLWGEWRAGELQQVAGQMALTGLTISHTEEDGRREGLFIARGAECWLRWRQQGPGWSLETIGLKLNFDGRRWPDTRLSLDYGGDGASRWRLATDYARLDDLALAAETLVPAAREFVAGWGWRGELQDLRLVVDGRDDAVPRGGLCAEFRRVGFNANDSHPGATELSGRVCGNDREAAAQLAAGPGSIELPAWFREPWPYDHLKGDLIWQRSDAGWKLTSRRLVVESPDLRLSSAFILSQAGDAPSPHLDWRGRAATADFGRVARYIPLRIVGPQAANWLEQAFVAGRLTAGDIWWHGALGAFPYDRGDGMFEAHARLEDAELRFARDWPALTRLQGDLHFVGAGLEVSNGHGLLAGMAADDIAVTIDRMQSDGFLAVAGRVEGGAPQALAFFRQTPKASIAKAFEVRAGLEGTASLDLLLNYPFQASTDAIKTAGEVRIRDGRLSIPAASLALEGFNGSVRFAESAMSDGHFDARWKGEPVLLSLASEGEELHVGANGRAPLNVLHDWQPGPWWQPMAGKLGYQLQLRLPESWAHAEAGMALDLQADLADAAVDLPPPLGKPLSAPADLELQAAWRQEGVDLRASYRGDAARLRTRLVKGAAGWDAPVGNLALGRDVPDALPSDGWRLSAKLGTVPLDAWWHWLSGDGKASTWGNRLSAVDLAIAEAAWEQRQWGPLSLALTRMPDAWAGRIDSAVATGKISVPAVWPGDKPLDLDLERLAIPETVKQTLENARQAQLDPTRLPGLRLHSGHLLWKNHDLGSISCNLERQPAGLRSGPCTVASMLLQMHFNGDWSRTSGKDLTRLDGKIRIEDLGRLLEQLDAGDEVIGTPADVKFALHWDDAPHRMTLGKLNGDVAVKLGEGSLRHVEPGVGRALGLFNIGTLKRRLTLDFSDVFDEGLAYDEVRSHFRIASGLAITRDLAIDGPSARVVVSGSADLPSRSLNNFVTVIPRTSLTLPLLGTLAGGPAVGGAVFLAQRLVGEKLEGITASQYHVKGSWDSPDVILVSRNTPVQLLLRAWESMTDFSGPAEPEEDKP